MVKMAIRHQVIIIPIRGSTLFPRWVFYIGIQEVERVGVEMFFLLVRAASVSPANSFLLLVEELL